MKGTRILFVEDDPVSAASVRAWLALKGAPATYAAGPAAADDELSRSEFDVLLSDIHMPGNENLSWVERVARRFPALHIVLLTGTPRIDTAIKATNLHVAAFLVKPPDFTELEAVITTLQATAHARQRVKVCLRDLQTALGRTDSATETRVASSLGELNELWPLIEADAQVRSISAASDLRQAVVEAVEVIERTKHSFRSRELGLLRQRLQRALTD